MAVLQGLSWVLLALLGAAATSPPPFPSPGSGPTRSSSVVLDPDSGKPIIIQGWDPQAIAGANFTEGIQETGWAALELVSNANYNDSLQAYAAGLAEAAVTNQLIYMQWMNTMMGYCGPFRYQADYCQKLKNYLETNLAWMQQQIKMHGEDDPYWYQVRLVLLQLKGLEDGYSGEVAFPTGQFSIAPFGFLLFQIGGDLEDLEAAFNKTQKRHDLGSGSCSALIKLLPGHGDLLISHDTWNNYGAMLRILKKYTLPFRTLEKSATTIPGHTQAFSSYPGSIFSGDDFYILSSGLVTLETTIGNSDSTLWKYIQPQGSVLEWLRNIVSNRLAQNGGDWALLFQMFNSGTYNNQWMIIDYKAFVPGKPSVENGVLVVLEQIPGMMVAEDKTELLYQEGYWASYNLPYFKEIYNASGLPQLVQKYGNWFTYDKNPRAEIFRRNHTLVQDMDSMIRLMRYNNFPTDPLSQCQRCTPAQNGENAISARSDLNPANGTYPFGAMRQRPHGGTDMKVTSFTMAQNTVSLPPVAPHGTTSLLSSGAPPPIRICYTWVIPIFGNSPLSRSIGVEDSHYGGNSMNLIPALSV